MSGHEAHGHGHSEETSITGILVSLILALLGGVHELLEKGEEVVQSVFAPDAEGHGGH